MEKAVWKRQRRAPSGGVERRRCLSAWGGPWHDALEGSGNAPSYDLVVHNSNKHWFESYWRYELDWIKSVGADVRNLGKHEHIEESRAAENWECYRLHSEHTRLVRTQGHLTGWLHSTQLPFPRQEARLRIVAETLQLHLFQKHEQRVGAGTWCPNFNTKSGCFVLNRQFNRLYIACDEACARRLKDTRQNYHEKITSKRVKNYDQKISRQKLEDYKTKNTFCKPKNTSHRNWLG